jgi:hypothetical protein
MAKRRKSWKTAHKSSGATVIERRANRCKLTVIPSDWTRPKGAAVWSTTCGSDHKRGNSKTVKSAKAAAHRAAKAMKR